MFDAHRLTRSCGNDAVLAASGLDAGLLVGTDYEIGRSQRPTLPDPLVEIKATTMPGGKDARPALARQLFEPDQAPLEEALAPLADDLARSVEPLCDLVIAQPLRSEEDDLGSNHVSIR
jgi:hypothetical protein